MRLPSQSCRRSVAFSGQHHVQPNRDPESTGTLPALTTPPREQLTALHSRFDGQFKRLELNKNRAEGETTSKPTERGLPPGHRGPAARPAPMQAPALQLPEIHVPGIKPKLHWL